MAQRMRFRPSEFWRVGCERHGRSGDLTRPTGCGAWQRKQWIEERLEALAKNFTVSVCGFAIMDKARVTSELRGIFERLGTSADFWEHRLKNLFGKSRLLGSYFATSRERLKEIVAASTTSTTPSHSRRRVNRRLGNPDDPSIRTRKSRLATCLLRRDRKNSRSKNDQIQPVGPIHRQLPRHPTLSQPTLKNSPPNYSV